MNRNIRYCCLSVSLFSMLACSNTDTDILVSETDIYIGFGVTMHDSRTLITQEKDMCSFKVWAWRTPENLVDAIQLFNAQMVNYDAGSGWTYAPLQSWVLYNTYDFYGLYPDTLTNSSYSIDGDLIIPLLDVRQSEGEYDVDKSVDVMHAYQQVQIVTTPPDKVVLNFEHLLTNVNFKLLKDNENANDKIVVTSIVLGGMNCIGSLSDDAWTFHDTETSYFYTLPNEELKTGETMLFGDMLMIPQTLTEEQPITFIVQYNYTQSGTDKSQQKYLMANLPTSTSWEKNTRVTYEATIHVDKNISFTTPKVESWGTEQVAGTIVIK